MLNHTFHLIQSYHLWFEIFDKPYEQGINATVDSSFDYETRPDGTMRVYIDIGLKMNYAAVNYRSGFELEGKGLTWKDIFVYDTISSMVSAAFNECNSGYRVFCEVNKLPLPEHYKVFDKLLASVTNSILERYTSYRSISDAENAYLINTIGFVCESEVENMPTFIYTFDILDEVLFYHPNFNKEHNRDVFSEIVPLPLYATLKKNCKAIEFNDISLSVYDMVMFFQCLDCAMQMLLGSKADSLIAVLEERGFDKEMQSAYIKKGTNYFKELRRMLKDSNARIINFENPVDWMSIIK